MGCIACCKFALGNQLDLLMFMNQLHTLRMSKGKSMEEYVSKTMDLKNKLLAIGEVVPNKFIYQFVLNGLPISYEWVVQTLSNMDTILTFDQLIAKLIAKTTHQEQWLCNNPLAERLYQCWIVERSIAKLKLHLCTWFSSRRKITISRCTWKHAKAKCSKNHLLQLWLAKPHYCRMHNLL